MLTIAIITTVMQFIGFINSCTRWVEEARVAGHDAIVQIVIVIIALTIRGFTITGVWLLYAF